MKEKLFKIFNQSYIYSLLVIIFLLPGFFFFKPVIFNVFELPKTELFNCLVFLSLFFFSSSFFINKNIKSKISLKVFALILLLVFSGFISATLSIHPELSFFGSYSRRQGFIQTVFYIIFFLLLLLALQDQKNRKKFLWAAIFSFIIPVSYGMMQFFRLDPMRWAEDFGRIFSTVGQPNFFAHYLILVIPLTIYSIIFLVKNFWLKFSLLILLLFQLICVYGTMSRAAWLALFVEILFLLIFYFWCKKRFKLLAVLFFASLFSLILIFAINFKTGSLSSNNNDSFFVSRVKSLFNWQIGSGSNRARLNYWLAAIDTISESSWKRKAFGHGQEALSDVFAAKYSPDWSLDERIYLIPDRAHNFVLDSILHFGFFGFAVFCLIFICFLKEIVFFLIKKERDKEYFLVVFSCSAILGYYFNNLFSFSITLQYVFFIFLLAMIVGIIFREKITKEINIKLSKFLSVFLLVSVAFIGVLFVFLRAGEAFFSDHQYVLARKNAGPNGCGALPYLKETFTGSASQNFYRSQYLDYGLKCSKSIIDNNSKKIIGDNLLVVLSQIPQKEKSYKILENEAAILSEISLYDDNFFLESDEKFFQLITTYQKFGALYSNRAQYLTAKGDYEEAKNILLKGLNEAFPKNWNDKNISILRRQDIEDQLSYFYEFLGNLYLLLNNDDEALSYYKRILKIDTQKNDIYKKIADIYEKKGDSDKALWYNERVNYIDKSKDGL